MFSLSAMQEKPRGFSSSEKFLVEWFHYVYAYEYAINHHHCHHFEMKTSFHSWLLPCEFPWKPALLIMHEYMKCKRYECSVPVPRFSFCIDKHFPLFHQHTYIHTTYTTKRILCYVSMLHNHINYIIIIHYICIHIYQIYIHNGASAVIMWI